jgi:hypothetical protein
MAVTSAPSKTPETLAERFWSLARAMDRDTPEGETQDPILVVRHVLRILDALDAGASGEGVTTNTVNFLTLLRQHELRGDLAYASPEQARGEQVDERSLVFSVGVLLFEKLTGRHPFGEKTNPRRVARIQKGEMGSGVNYFPHVPPALRSVLMKAMGPFPEERWESLAALRAELEVFEAEETTPRPTSRPVTIMPRTAKGTAPPPVPEAAMAKGSGSVFADVFEDDGPTRMVNRPREVAAPSARAISVPGATLRSSGVILPATAPAARPLVTWRRYAPVGWAALGASVCALAFVLFGGRSAPTAPVGPGRATAQAASAAAPSPLWTVARAGSSNAGSELAAAVAAPAGAAAAPAGSVTDVAPAAAPVVTPVASASAAAAQAPAAAVAPAAASAASAASAPSVEAPPGAAVAFDPALEGQRAATAIEPCFSPERLGRGARFNAGLLWSKDGTIKKIYYGSLDELSLAERGCVSKAWHAIVADRSPAKNIVVEYGFRVRAGGSEVRVK